MNNKAKRKLFKKEIILSLLFTLFISSLTHAQSSIEVSAGLGFQDNFTTQFALRTQISEKFRGGFEFQYGNPKYRFVGTKTMREGYSFSLSLPMSFQLLEEEKIQLYGIGRLGARFQGIIDPDGNDMMDSVLTSNALIMEFGFLTSFPVSEKINLQGGMTLPIAYELSPMSLMEYAWVKLHLGGSLNLNKNTFFLHTNLGHAFGATGDTYKYIWSIEAGIRHSFGTVKNANFNLIDPSF